MKASTRIGVAASLLLLGVAEAHHSASATYDPNAEITIEGTLVGIQLMNPHSFMTVQVAERSGSKTRWTAEWLSYRGLETAGVTRATLRPGDRLMLSGLPARRAEEKRILLRRIERPADGWHWSGSGEDG
jgi:Family of unknown function (DUF6152)